MLVSVLALALPFLAAVSATPRPGACNADLCARGVFGTNNRDVTPATASVDCAKNLACSVTPSASIVTETTTVTQGTQYITLPAVTNAPVNTDAVTTCGTNVPSYASFCSGFVRYSSACSCGGFTATTDVAATPTSTATVVYTQPAQIVYVTAGPQIRGEL